MKKHFNNTELKRLIDGKYDFKTLAGISKHIAQCHNCKINLKKISPTFLEDSFDHKTRLVSEQDERHFSYDQIQDFLKAKLSFKHRMEMSDHFRNCFSCKQKLYETDSGYLRANIASYLSRKEEKQTFLSGLKKIVPVFVPVIVLAGLIGFIFFSDVNRQPDIQAKIIGDTRAARQSNPANPADSDSMISYNTENSIDSDSSGLTRKTIDSAKNALTSAANSRTNLSTKTGESARSAKSDKNMPAQSLPKVNRHFIVSESRSANTVKYVKNTSDATLSTCFEMTKETQPIFRWKPVTNATKYNFYLSNTTQILIEEFESTSATSYTPKNKLELNKTYKWKVIATLPDGKTQQSPLTPFSLSEKPAQYKSELLNKKAVEILCRKK